jgi:hypothetical protein
MNTTSPAPGQRLHKDRWHRSETPVRSPDLAGPLNPQLGRNQFKSEIVLERLDFLLQSPQSNLLPGGRGVVMLADKAPRQSIELGFLFAGGSIVAVVELANIQEGDDQKVESVQTGFLHGKPSVAVGSIAAFDLDPDLRQLVFACPVAGIGVNADQIIPLVVGGGFVGEDVPPHQVTHHQRLRPGRDDRETQKVRFGVRHGRHWLCSWGGIGGENRSSRRCSATHFTDSVNQCTCCERNKSRATFWREIDATHRRLGPNDGHGATVGGGAHGTSSMPPSGRVFKRFEYPPLCPHSRNRTISMDH